MEIYETHSEIGQRRSWLLSLTVIVLITFGILVLLQGLALGLVPFLFHIEIDSLMGLMSGNYDVPNGRMAMLFVQGIGSGIGFWVSAWVLTKFVEKADLKWDIQLSRVQRQSLMVMVGLTFGAMLFNGLLVYWNSKLVLPESMAGMEQWMKEMETQLMELTKFLTDFQTVPELLMGIVVIGILAGIGEEMLFRGVIQPKMQQYLKSAHWGIWLTAFIFSAIHFQFYGFLPRLFLGALFGYMYHYSGSLIYPILAHILNNSLTVVMVYLANQEVIDFDLESADTVSYPASLIGLLVLLVGFFYFKKINQPKDGQLDQGF